MSEWSIKKKFFASQNISMKHYVQLLAKTIITTLCVTLHAGCCINIICHNYVEHNYLLVEELVDGI